MENNRISCEYLNLVNERGFKQQISTPGRICVKISCYTKVLTTKSYIVRVFLSYSIPQSEMNGKAFVYHVGISDHSLYNHRGKLFHTLVRASVQIIYRQGILMQILLVVGSKIVLFTSKHTVANIMSVHRPSVDKRLTCIRVIVFV